MEGLLGLRKDGRRLILHPRSETEFTSYDVTVLKKLGVEKRPGRMTERMTHRVRREQKTKWNASATFSESDERNRQNDQCSPSENTMMGAAVPRLRSGTPPLRWYAVNNQSVVTAPMVPLDQNHAGCQARRGFLD